MKRRLPESFSNPITYAGVALAAVALGLIVFLFIVELLSSEHHPYMGLIAFVILPMFLCLGLLIAIGGIIRTGRRLRSGDDAATRLPRLDLNDPQHRNGVALFCGAGLLFVTLSAFGSYQAYEYTDSVEFCGRVCHKVMKPEYVAYQSSPHARVKCVECHIGPGATWYVRSKLSGAYQLYSTALDKYHRPIRTPIRDLRPAKETCEQCHSPQHFFSTKTESKTYFLSDKDNTRSQITMQLKVGGGDPAHGATDGIHYHMYLNRTVSYVAMDREREIIPYVESRSPDGKVTVFRSTEHRMTDGQVKRGEKRTVDCIDCHNRPSHQYPHPAQSVNDALARGRISTRLPEIKRVAVEALQASYKTEPEALEGIEQTIREFYQGRYPEVARSSKADVDAAVRETQRIFSRSFFPEMKTDWRAFPDHKSHLYSQGCFRCHDGKHVSDDGKVISKDCNSCHTITAQRFPGQKQQVSLTGLQYLHPVYIGNAWKEKLCSDCHAKQLPVRPRSHKPGFLLSHGRPARANPAACITCHQTKEAKGVATPAVATASGASARLASLSTAAAFRELARSEFCETCHLRENPHPSDFRKHHGPEALSQNANCTTCHADTKFCDSCHGMPMPHPQGFLRSHAPLAKTQSAQCATCHTREECATCHQSTKPLSHLGNFVRTHGRSKPTAAECSTCHQRSDCASCHQRTKPSNHTAAFRGNHRQAFFAKQQDCNVCHTQSSCDSCHGVRMPHPSNFATAHGPQARGKIGTCTKCHQRSECLKCHLPSALR